MVRMFKQFFWLMMLTLSVERAAAFTFLGPFETYQVPVIAHNIDGDLGGPHNLGEEYRRNTPVLYYTFDQNFIDYFGSNGVAAVEEAFAIMNSLTNVDHYSDGLFEWPMEALSYNFKAQALNLFDLKSVALGALLEQMGLGEPERFTWTLHDRDVGPGGCPADVSYFVIKRNFEPAFTALDVLQPSSYVNGTFYSYFIFEICTGPNPLADALEFPVDPSATTFSAVAGLTLPIGGYYTGLTRDDVGGIRYLYRTNNMNFESAGVTTLTVATNFNATAFLFTSNLTLLVNQALTNDAAQLQALYPNLVISSTTQIPTNIVSTNVFFYFTNYPWAPAGTVALAFQTNITTDFTFWYSHTFGNVVTNSYYTNGSIIVLETSVGPRPFGSPTQVYTNVTARTILTNFISGDYYILPTNSDCGAFIISTNFTAVTYVTNTPVAATNVAGGTNIGGVSFVQELVFPFTNSVYLYHPVPCISNSVALRQGIGRVQFVRRDFDSLIGSFFSPVTNTYTHTIITNSTPFQQLIVRTVTQPDILITAEDLTTESPTVAGFTFGAFQRNLPFSTNSLPGLFGPGTIENQPNVELSFNKVGPLFLNFTPFNLDEITQLPLLTWGSFDGSTNAPVVYPNGTSVLNYEQNVFIQVTPVYLPEGFVTATPQRTNYYTAQLQVASYTSAFVLPATWAFAPGSLGLPPGLELSPSGAITGTPTMTGTFDFVVRVTDSQSRTTDRSFFIKVSP